MSPRYACSAPTRTEADCIALDRVDASIRDLAMSLGAIDLRYASLIARRVLEEAEYPKAFPHLLLSATRQAAAELPAQTDWCLSPAVCYHAYAQFAERTIAEPFVVTARGRCFRAERDSTPGIRQVEFDMREIVLFGSQVWIDGMVNLVRGGVEMAAQGFDLRGEWQVAEDPFFLPSAAGKALMQRLLEVKLEYQWPRAGGLALASINRHGVFFGERFQITAADGQPIHTACIAIGLDRWAHVGHITANGGTLASAEFEQEAQP